MLYPVIKADGSLARWHSRTLLQNDTVITRRCRLRIACFSCSGRRASFASRRSLARGNLSHSLRNSASAVNYVLIPADLEQVKVLGRCLGTCRRIHGARSLIVCAPIRRQKYGWGFVNVNLRLHAKAQLLASNCEQLGGASHGTLSCHFLGLPHGNPQSLFRGARSASSRLRHFPCMARKRPAAPRSRMR